MSIRVELTYDMGKALGTHAFELESASTVADVVEQTRARFGAAGAEFAKLARVEDGDRVGFVKAAAGG